MQAYWLVVRVLLTPPAEAAAGQKWKIIYLQVLMPIQIHLKIAWRWQFSTQPDEVNILCDFTFFN